MNQKMKYSGLLAILPLFTKNKSYGLDIGIANDPWAEFKNCEMVGVDKNPYPSVDKIIDLEDGVLPYSSNLFDVVIAINSLNFVKNHQPILNEINRVMKNNAVLVCVVDNQNRPNKSINNHWTQSYLNKNLKQSGFESILFKNLKDYFWAKLQLAHSSWNSEGERFPLMI